LVLGDIIGVGFLHCFGRNVEGAIDKGKKFSKNREKSSKS
jgi:hypothetical protein